MYRIAFTITLSCLSIGFCSENVRAQSEQNAEIFHPQVRQDLFISGVYPHLTTYGVYSQNGGHFRGGHNECGIGAVVPWAGKLWMVNYAPHMPKGSEHKLFSIDEDLNLEIFEGSVGGTPAARMIHRESNQLLIAHYLIDADGKIRVISPKQMPGRLTAIARHLKDPKNLVYYIDMEGMVYEANVHTLETKLLFKKPVPGWHGKGGYTSQGRLVVSNNGEYKAGSYDALLVGGPPKNSEEAGVLAEWNGDEWKIVERKQFTDITGPGGIYGAANDRDPMWAIGWDRRSLRLKLLDEGKWHTFLLPKAAHNNDPIHGWYTEWPRIREIGNGKMLMDMHGMFFDFPKTFSAKNTAGIKPVGSHLRYIPDFCEWNGRLVLASDETSIQGNNLAGQPQSNLWFGQFEDLKSWGPASGFGGPWVGDNVKAGVPSDPFLIAGFDRRLLHLSLNDSRELTSADKILRATDQQRITQIPDRLKRLPRVTIKRGDWKKPAPGYQFEINVPATVYLAVDQRGTPKLDGDWQPTNMTLKWGKGFSDAVYKREFKAGTIQIPGNKIEHIPGSFGMPHTAFVMAKSDDLVITPNNVATVTVPKVQKRNANGNESATFKIEVDENGRGEWTTWKSITVSDYQQVVIPPSLKAEWMRLIPDKDCVATAYFHLTDADYRDASKHEEMFAGLADVDSGNAFGARLYPAKRNRNLRVVTDDDRYFEFTRNFEFKPDQPDEKLNELLKVEREFTVDDASVILETNGRKLRLPKGHKRFDKPFDSGWPRGSREVQSERHLANFHGTFYEVPLITNGNTPAFHLMRPVASHSKQIADFCSWNGLLVMSGTTTDAAKPASNNTENLKLWFGGVDDLWKLGKPIGEGGPWKNTDVMPGVPSDPYLMTGYDRKTLTLESCCDVTVVAEIDFDHQTGWHQYKKLDVVANEKTVFEFPKEFSAHWIRFVTDREATVTAWLKYE